MVQAQLKTKLFVFVSTTYQYWMFLISHVDRCSLTVTVITITIKNIQSS